MRATVCVPSELGGAETGLWCRFQAEQGLENPFLSAGFAQAVGNVDRKARVGVLHDGPNIVGFLAFTLQRLRTGSAIAKGLSDAQAFVSRSDLEWNFAEVIAACGLDHWEFDHLVGTQAPDGPSVVRVPSPGVDTSQSYDEYLRRIRAGSKKFVKILEQKERRLRREHPDLSFEFAGHDQRSLSQLIRWKSDQYRRTGRRDIFRRPGIIELVEILASTDTPSLRGCISVLSIGSRPIAADFSVASESVFAGWLASYERDLAFKSPGAVQFLYIIRAACLSPIRYVDLGKGDEGYKSKMATESIGVAEAGSGGRASVRSCGGRSTVRSPWRAGPY